MALSPREPGEMIITFDDNPPPYEALHGAASAAQDGPSPGTAPYGSVRSQGVKSDASVDLQGPMEVDGCVKSMGNITFTGDFTVRGNIEAYGYIDLAGRLICQ
jgi:hypothetical protein